MTITRDYIERIRQESVELFASGMHVSQADEDVRDLLAALDEAHARAEAAEARVREIDLLLEQAVQRVCELEQERAKERFVRGKP
jgi:hypothetical protein